MANKKFPKNKPITIPIQKYNIRREFKNIILREYNGIGLKMLLNIQPTEFSKKYKVTNIFYINDFMTLWFYFLFTPIIPPSIPNIIAATIIIIELTFNENFQFKILDIRYIIKI